jgi:hypothetical protein
MRKIVSYTAAFCAVVFVVFSAGAGFSQEGAAPVSGSPVSPQTRTCIGCHSIYTPGIYHDWLSSRHSQVIASEAMKKFVLQRRISTENLPGDLRDVSVGCYECHGRNPESHQDNFEHFGFKINVIVTPNDCKTCHPVEVGQFAGSKKSHAYKNLMENPVYLALVNSITGVKRSIGGKITSEKPSQFTLHETCLGCHGTKVERKGIKNVTTKIGEVAFPVLTNWPNQGVGRINPDGSTGACTACHARHGFSIEMARKPYTCSQCHLEPDVPAWNVYDESKHGDIYFSKYHDWDFHAVPWTVGKDFRAPTCATCHNSLVVSPTGNVIAERSHNFGARLWVRIFGLIYSHPQPRSGDTTLIRNKDNLPLPTAFTAEPASDYLIDSAERGRRLNAMKDLCNGCHSTGWANGHFEKFENTLKETNEMTLTATNLLGEAWAKGIEDKSNPFDEAIEQMWIRQWLFYSNSIRFASAMTGAPDYTAFKNGWWYLTENLRQIKDLIKIKKNEREKD